MCLSTTYKGFLESSNEAASFPCPIMVERPLFPRSVFSEPPTRNLSIIDPDFPDLFLLFLTTVYDLIKLLSIKDISLHKPQNKKVLIPA